MFKQRKNNLFVVPTRWDDGYNQMGTMNNVIPKDNDYSKIFLMKVKEYVMGMNNKNILYFVAKVIMLMHIEDFYGYTMKHVKYHFNSKIRNKLPTLSFYKTNIVKYQKINSAQIMQNIVKKYANDQLSSNNVTVNVFNQPIASASVSVPGQIQLKHQILMDDPTEDTIDNELNSMDTVTETINIDEAGIKFTHDDIHYYCYYEEGSDTNSDSRNEFPRHVLECSSNLDQDEAQLRIKKLFLEATNNFEHIYVYDQQFDPSGSPNGTSIISTINRKLDNIFLQEDIEMDIYNFISKYKTLRGEYNKMGIQFKNNFLVYGKPGTGKTTLAKVMAYELKRNIILINLKNITNAQNLHSIIKDNSQNIIVFEELDCLIEKIKKRKELEESIEQQMYDNTMPGLQGNFQSDMNGLTVNDVGIQNRYSRQPRPYRGAPRRPMPENELELSDFLEILDGMRSTNNSIIFFTTNHIDRIDPAFKRAGRMNYLIEMKLCNMYQFKKIFKNMLDREPSDDVIKMFDEYVYSLATIIETVLKNIFELKNGSMTDVQLFEKIKTNHNNFVQTNPDELQEELKLPIEVPRRAVELQEELKLPIEVPRRAVEEKVGMTVNTDNE